MSFTWWSFQEFCGVEKECWSKDMENDWLIDFFEEFENPIEQEEESDVDLIILTKGGIGGKV